jgi:predicted Zn-dependent peptidase
VSVRVNTGSANDSKSGTNALLSRLSQQKIASELANSGVKLTTQACREQTVYSARVLKGDAGKVLSILADGVINPPLDAQSVDAQRSLLLNEVNAVSKKYQERLFYHLFQTAFMDSGPCLSMSSSLSLILFFFRFGSAP